MRQPSVKQSHFAMAPSAGIQRSKFDRSHAHKTTFDAGLLIPIFVDEALPGDTFNLNASFFARLNTPLVPVMDNAYFETFFFEVPVRQVWQNWEKFNGAQDDPGDSTDYLIPQQVSPASTGYAEQSLQDYMGIPPGVPDLTHSALFTRAYNKIYNEWFRDQNLQASINVNVGDGPDSVSNYILRRRGKRHDYFTSALPWPQKSDSGSVQLPLGSSAPIKSDTASGSLGILDSSDTLSDMDASLANLAMGTNNPASNQMFADLSEATAATINQLRQSIAVQRLYEKDARGGTRYIEVIKNHFKVNSPDLRLQRPGYLGGGRSMINISPVANTVGDAAGAPQGDLAGYGTITATNHGFTRSFTEHSIIIGLCSVRADLTYQRSLDRMWSRSTRFDHYWPELSTIGEQEVLAKEIWATGIPAGDDKVWAYQERYAEYRYKPSLITGKMRSSSPTSLDFWHLSQDFGTEPQLNSSFIEENPPFDRVVATPDEPHFKLDSYFNLKCARPMPMFGIPGLDKL